MWSGIHSVCTSVWSFISSVYHTVVCGTTNVMTGVGSVFTNAYNRGMDEHSHILCSINLLRFAQSQNISSQYC